MMEYRKFQTLTQEEKMSSGSDTDIFRVQECPKLGLEILKGVNKLREDDALCDVTLIADGTEFKCHRAVLASCSDYFFAMFTNGMQESSQKEIELKGITAKGLQKVLEVMYTSTTTLERDYLLDTIDAAMHLLATPAIEFCERHFLLFMTTTNFHEFAFIANHYYMEKVLQQIDVFIARNLMQIVKDGTLKLLTFEQMMNCLESDNLRCREKDVFDITWQWLKMDPDWYIHAPALMKLIRFPLIRDTDLSYESQEVLLMKTHPELRKILLAALNYHVYPHSQPLINSDSNRLRSCVERLVSVGGIEIHSTPSMHDQMLILDSKISSDNMLKCHQTVTLPGPLSHMQVIVYNNFLYVLGGITGFQSPNGEYAVNSVLRYNPRIDKWFGVCSMLERRAGFFACAFKDKIYAIGGCSNEITLASVECYNLEENTWEFISSMPMPSRAHAGVVYRNHIFITGGISADHLTSEMQRYDPGVDTWEEMAPMLIPRAWHVMCVCHDKFYVFGGCNVDFVNQRFQAVMESECYNPATNQWTIVAPILIPHKEASCVAYGDNIYVMGGYNMQTRSGQKMVSKYNVLSNTWEVVGALPQSMTGVGCCKIQFPFYAEEEVQAETE